MGVRLALVSIADGGISMKQTVMIMCAALALAAAPVFAQTGQSKSGAATKAGATADTAFAKEAAIGGMAEVDLGNLAKQNASNQDVKQFGDRMVTDHSKANDELKQWASSNNVTLPTELDAKHKALKDRLSKLNGDAFDKAYMRAMVSDHKEDVAKFRRESTSGKNADLKAWAGKTLPTLEDHLKMAQDTATKVGAAAKSTVASKKK
jgi:putative membrane protein